MAKKRSSIEEDDMLQLADLGTGNINPFEGGVSAPVLEAKTVQEVGREKVEELVLKTTQVPHKVVSEKLKGDMLPSPSNVAGGVQSGVEKETPEEGAGEQFAELRGYDLDGLVEETLNNRDNKITGLTMGWTDRSLMIVDAIRNMLEMTPEGGSRAKKYMVTTLLCEFFWKHNRDEVLKKLERYTKERKKLI